MSEHINNPLFLTMLTSLNRHTGSGKSTSIHYLCGSQFRLGDQGNVIVYKTAKSLKDKDIEIGQSIAESKTKYIAEVPLDLLKLGIEVGRKDPTQILLVDTPGFEDTTAPEVNLVNGIGTIRALKGAKKVKVIITFKEADFDYKFKAIRNIANNMDKAMTNLVREVDKRDSPISGFLTKSQHGVKAAMEEFARAYDEEQMSSDGNRIFQV